MGGMRFISTAVRTICGVGISYGVSVACIRIVKCAEGTEWELGRRDRIFLIISSFAFSLLTVMLPGMDIVSEMLSEILVGALLFACVTDVKSCEVYQFTLWIAGVADVLMWIYEGGLRDICIRVSIPVFFVVTGVRFQQMLRKGGLPCICCVRCGGMCAWYGFTGIFCIW